MKERRNEGIGGVGFSWTFFQHALRDQIFSPMLLKVSFRYLALLLAACPHPLHAASENYLDYYRGVAVAETAVADGKYGDALRQYDQIFRQFSYNNPIDCYIAAQLAAFTGDTSECKAHLRRGISFGLPRETVRSNPHLSSYLDSTQPHALTRELVDSCWAVYRQRIDQDARSKAISLIRRDQAVI